MSRCGHGCSVGSTINISKSLGLILKAEKDIVISKRKSINFVATVSGPNLMFYITFQHGGTLNVLHRFKWNLAHTDGTVGWHQETPWTEPGIFKISHSSGVSRSQILFVVVVIVVCAISENQLPVSCSLSLHRSHCQLAE